MAKRTDVKDAVTKPEEGISVSTLFLSLACIILGFNIGIYHGAIGFGYGIFHLFATIGIFIALPREKRAITSILTAVVSIVSGFLVFYRANGFVQAMDYMVATGALGYLMLLVSAPQIPSTIWELIASGVLYAIQSIFGPFRLIQRMSEGGLQDTGTSSWMQPFKIMKTAGITVIIFAVFAGILMSADPIFKQMAEKFVEQIVGRVGWSVFLAAVFAGCLTIVLSKQEKKYLELGFLSTQDVVIPVVSLVGLFGMFLSIQSKYLYASHEIFKQFNITYSQYVRQGFTELLTAAAIASVISYVVIIKNRVSGKPVLTWLNVVLILELILLFASAWRRDVMYIEVFGLTRMRIIGEVFLFWLLGNVVLLLLVAVWKQFEEKHFMIGMSIISLCTLGYLSAVNMDMRIVGTPPKRDGMTDLFYLANMSEDSASSWESIVVGAESLYATLKDKAVLTDEEKSRLTNAKLAMYSLVAQREQLEKKYGDWDNVKKLYRDEIPKKPYEVGQIDSQIPWEIRKKDLNNWFDHNRRWQAYNRAEYEGYQYLTKNRAVLFDRVDSFLYQLDTYQKLNHIDLAEQERWILYDFKYPYIRIKTTMQPQYGRYPTATVTSTPFVRNRQL